MRKLPPLRSLQVFEAAARLLHFSKAGEELCISQSAVSHQIRQLETYLGVSLFSRRNRQLALTPEGRTLAAELETSLNHLARVCSDLRGESKVEIRLVLYSSFAVKWLIPRLGDFKKRHPLIKLRLDMLSQDPMLHQDSGDLYISSLTGGSGYWHRTLHRERMIPVCSPEYLAESPQIALERFEYQTLLAVDEGELGVDWERWSLMHGTRMPDSSQVQMFSHVLLSVEAAAAGLGIALASDFIVQGDLASGRLIALDWPDLHTGFEFNLCCKRRKLDNPDIRLFVDWLLEQSESLPGATV